jgi:hypothetical protein
MIGVLLHTPSISLNDYLPAEEYHTTFGEILKIGVERLDNVRSSVGRFVQDWVTLDINATKTPEYCLHGLEIIKSTLP